MPTTPLPPETTGPLYEDTSEDAATTLHPPSTESPISDLLSEALSGALPTTQITPPAVTPPAITPAPVPVAPVPQP